MQPRIPQDRPNFYYADKSNRRRVLLMDISGKEMRYENAHVNNFLI